ncbi:MAG: MarR family transcriptional regulator [Bacteriovorax sp.]|nr:MarR family transcriptional regulator [Bacteriovorax sp.]
MRFKDTIGISYYLRKTELILRQKIDRVLEHLELTVPKYSVLAILEEEDNKLTNAELARRASVTPQTMNRLLHAMENDGLVKSKNDKANELKIFYTLTKKAHKVVCSAHTEVNRIETLMLEGLSQKEVSGFMCQLEKMNLKLEEKK